MYQSGGKNKGEATWRGTKYKQKNLRPLKCFERGAAPVTIHYAVAPRQFCKDSHRSRFSRTPSPTPYRLKRPPRPTRNPCELNHRPASHSFCAVFSQQGPVLKRMVLVHKLKQMEELDLKQFREGDEDAEGEETTPVDAPEVRFRKSQIRSVEN